MNSGIVFQSRDYALLLGLFESRVMTQKHMAALYFDGRLEAAKKRIQKLKVADIIRERARRPYEPGIYFITKKGYELLRDQGLLDAYPRFGWESLRKRAQVSDLTLRHELAVMDVKAAMISAIDATKKYEVVEFSTWPLLYQFRARRPATRTASSKTVLVKPDAQIRIQEKEPDGYVSEHRFYLEVDRGTETLETLARRAACYVNYYKSGGLAIRNRCLASAYKDFPFRVLMVLPSAERRNNTAMRLIDNHPPILTQVQLTTYSEITNNPSGCIWTMPKDYRYSTVKSSDDNGLCTLLGHQIAI